jgi:hypothetical protein
MQIAERVYSLAQEQNDPALMIGAYRALAATFCCMGDFETARQYAMHGVQIWRSGSVQSRVEGVLAQVVGCLCHRGWSEWHLGEIASCQATTAEVILLAKKLNDMSVLALSQFQAGLVGHFERDPAEVERCASNMIELSTRHNFDFWRAAGEVFRGWAQGISGSTSVGIALIEEGIRDIRATGTVLDVPYWLALKAEVLHLADRTSEALKAITEAEALVVRTEARWWCAELNRLRGVFLATLGAEETQIEASFSAAIRIAREQRSVSLAKRAEGTYAEYRRQKASVSEGRGFRLPLW